MFVNDQRGKFLIVRLFLRNDDYNKNINNQDLNISYGLLEFYLSLGNNDALLRLRFDSRFEYRFYGRFYDLGNSRSNYYDRDREIVKLGMFRSRIFGFEMISRGLEYRNEFQRFKILIVYDMRSKIFLLGYSYGYLNVNYDFGGGYY